MSSSELSKLNPNETTPDEIRGAFCRDVARVSRSYEVTIDLSFRCTQYWSYGCTTVQQKVITSLPFNQSQHSSAVEVAEVFYVRVVERREDFFDVLSS